MKCTIDNQWATETITVLHTQLRVIPEGSSLLGKSQQSIPYEVWRCAYLVVDEWYLVCIGGVWPNWACSDERSTLVVGIFSAEEDAVEVL